MKIYDETKTKTLKEYDLNKGYLKDDVIIIHHPEVPFVKEEGHYETIAEYPNGGKDVEWIVDVQGTEYKEAYDENIAIKVYIPYSKIQLEKMNMEQQIEDLKQYLFDTDYVCCKLMEANSKFVISGDNLEIINLMEHYKDVLNKREKTRKEISTLEEKLKNI